LSPDFDYFDNYLTRVALSPNDIKKYHYEDYFDEKGKVLPLFGDLGHGLPKDLSEVEDFIYEASARIKKRGRKMLMDLLRDIVDKHSQEFVPALDARNSTTQANLKSSVSNTNGIENYLENIANQEIVFCVGKTDEVVGMLTWRPDAKTQEFMKLPNAYLSTIIVSRNHRGNKLASNMYDMFEDICTPKAKYTRTWSGNASHLNLLGKRGYKLMKTIKGDRGKGIDTVYYGKENDDE
jgi:ribosomal protein S18 acetylase RimI-like enzyme